MPDGSEEITMIITIPVEIAHVVMIAGCVTIATIFSWNSLRGVVMKIWAIVGP